METLKTLKHIVLLIGMLLMSFVSVGQTYTADQAGIIGTGTSAQSCAPIDLWYKSFLNQSIYTADEIGLEGKSATIKTISFQYDYTTSYTSNSFTVYLGNTTKSSFSSNTDWITTGNMSSVYTGTITTGSTNGAWVTITLSSTFYYTGGNLVVCLFDNNCDSYPGTSSSDWRYTTTSDYKFIYYRSDGTTPTISTSTSGTRSYNRPNIKLNIGGTSVITNSTTFYDSGNSTGQYSNYEDYIWTFKPSINDCKIVLDITNFNSESNWDYFRIYNGENTSAAQLLNYSGTSSPNPTHFEATNQSGALTIWWHSDGSNTYNGWIANISQICSSTYTVTYDANGGTGTMTDSNSPYNAGSTVTTMTNTFINIGYTFAGWNTVGNGSGTAYAEGATFTINEDITLYAQWTLESSTIGCIQDGFGSGTTSYAPFQTLATNWLYMWLETIYPHTSELVSGDITSISYECTTANAANLDLLNIYIGTTGRNTHSAGNDWQSLSNLTLVYSHTNVTVSNTVGWETFNFDIPWHYNGTDNIVVVIQKKQSIAYRTTNYRCSSYSTLEYSGSTESYSNYPGTNTGTIYMSWAPNIQFCYSGWNLPISLLSFTASPQPECNLVQWTTAIEKNNDLFILERSEDAIVFDEVYNVSGAGNSLEPLDYDFKDYQPASDITYYRLTQVDYDGSKTTSEIVSCIRTSEKMSNWEYFTRYDNLVQVHSNDKVLTIVCSDLLGRTIWQGKLLPHDDTELNLQTPYMVHIYEDNVLVRSEKVLW